MIDLVTAFLFGIELCQFERSRERQREELFQERFSTSLEVTE